MSGAIYNLQYVIPKVDFDSAASKIESVEFKVFYEDLRRQVFLLRV